MRNIRPAMAGATTPLARSVTVDSSVIGVLIRLMVLPEF
jgi:hypothetical protein